MNVLFINNRDSFVWNLVDYVSIYDSESMVVLNTISLDEVKECTPDKIVISPGPGHPKNSRDVGNCLEIIHEFGAHIPILGVCFGNQAINMAYGGTIIHSPHGPVHGKSSDILHDGSELFDGIPKCFAAGRYHSLVIGKLANDLKVIAKTEDGTIMGVRHRNNPVYGVQFHPESVLTPVGKQLISNFLNISVKQSKD